MMKVLDAAQMQACDHAAIEEYRIPGALLMENAGLQVLDVTQAMAGGSLPQSTAVICGRGNNGGDGLVVARHLHNLGREAVVYLVGDAARLDGDARLNHEIACAFGVRVVPLDESRVADLASELGRFELVIDALLGTGIRGAARGLAVPVIEAMNGSTTPVLAIDLPSGLQADRGAVEGVATEAAATVCLAALKPCHVLGPACDFCGEIELVEISMPAPLLEAAEPALRLLEAADVAATLPVRATDSHKGDYGRVLVIGGARGTSGAAALAARGALRSGAGLVDLACPEPLYEVVGSSVPEALVHPLAADPEGRLAVDSGALDLLLDTASVAVVGPGLGTGGRVTEMVQDLARTATIPLVLDADGLNALVGDPSVVAAAQSPRVLTPHPGEAARLLGVETREVQADRPAAAARLANLAGAVVVLKGYRTLIAAPARVTVVNPTGNAGMATGGTGDVLAGAAGALIAQGLDPFRAAWAGAWLHGAAGDVAAGRVGQIPMTAGDLAEALPAAFAALETSL